MKITPLRFLATVIGVLVVGLGAGWFVLTGNALTNVQRVVEELNEKKLADNGSVKITYDSLSRSGFPALGVRLVNPMLAINVPGDGAERQPVDLAWKRSGTFDIVTDYVRHEYRVISDGSGSLTLQSGSDKVAIESADARIEASITARSRAAFDAWGSLDLEDKQAVRAALRDVAAAKLSMGAFVMKNTTTDATIFTQEHANIALANRGKENVLDFDLDVDVKASELTKEYSAVASTMLRIFQLPQAMDDAAVPLSATRAGKQDITMALRVNVPESPTGMEIPKGFIHVDRFSITNNFYHLEAPLHVVLDDANDQRSANIKVNALLEVKPAGAEEMTRLVDGIDPRVQPVLAQLAGASSTTADPEQVKQKMLAALPTLSTLGPVKLVVDLEAAVPTPREGGLAEQEKEGEVRRQNLTLRAFHFDHARWGIEAKGMAAKSGKEDMQVDMKLVCKRCSTMTKDIYDTAQGVQDVLNFINPERAPWPVDAAMLARIDSTLAEIGRKDEASGDITFSIGATKPNELHINDRPIEEVMPKLLAIFMPAMASADALPNNGEVLE